MWVMMIVKILGYSTTRSQMINVLHVLVCLKMMKIQWIGYNVLMRVVRCEVMQNVWRCVTKPTYVWCAKLYFLSACMYVEPCTCLMVTHFVLFTVCVMDTCTI